MTFFIKRALDLLVSVFLLLLLLPLGILIAILVKITSPGPVLFCQKRLGRDLVPFTMLKFRTMVDNAERMGTGLFSYQDDPRITWLGRILRRTSLDELPQLLNVISGSMSIVGPRPPVSYELGDPAAFDAATRARFRVRPGITGLAQVSGRNELEWPEKIVKDNEYIDLLRQRGIVVDFAILFKTAMIVACMRNIIEPRREG